jgi:hypothetical protein
VQGWKYAISPAALHTLDEAVASIPHPDARAAAQRLLEVGLRRRYSLVQITCGYRAEKYPGLLALLASVAVARPDSG